MNTLSSLPSVDRLLHHPLAGPLIDDHGHRAVTQSARDVLSALRHTTAGSGPLPDTDEILQRMAASLRKKARPTLTRVLNLTGTILHTNLGRAALPPEAMEAISRIAAGASNLEYDLATGLRGDRDDHVESVLTELTGAEAATVVNNNAAAVLLTLNTLAQGKEVPVSRGELVEIGGSFRIPEIMEKSGCTLIEIGATNRTHLADYEKAINVRTGLLMKVHTSNYEIQGFTASVQDQDIATLAREKDLPFVTDLGSGTLLDLSRWGLPHEPTAGEAITAGASIVTFSGDKLLGGPQAGIIIGERTLIEAIKSNPLKRALRVDKMTMAALFEVLKLYRNPDTLDTALPTLRMLSRSLDDIVETAGTLLPPFVTALQGKAVVSIIETQCQIGSGSLPLDLLPSRALCVEPVTTRKRDTTLRGIAAAFRRLPVPVIGRIHDGRLLFDLRTLDDPSVLTGQLGELVLP